MKKIKEYWFEILLSFIGLIIISALYDELVNKREVSMSGVVKSHDITFSRSGSDVYYRTIVLCDDGVVEEITGMKAYIIPVGSKVYFKTRRREK